MYAKLNGNIKFANRFAFRPYLEKILFRKGLASTFKRIPQLAATDILTIREFGERSNGCEVDTSLNFYTRSNGKKLFSVIIFTSFFPSFSQRSHDHPQPHQRGKKTNNKRAESVWKPPLVDEECKSRTNNTRLCLSLAVILLLTKVT